MKEHSKKALLGIILVCLGVLFLFDTLGLIDFWDAVEILWPLILIAIGLYIIFKRRTSSVHGRKENAAVNSCDGISGIAGDIVVSGLTGGVGDINRSLLFGDIIIDLTGAKLNDGNNYVDVSVLFGDVKITVPDDFPVSVDMTCCAGSVEYNDKKSDGIFPNIKHKDDGFESSPAKLFIKCRACFGDLKVNDISK